MHHTNAPKTSFKKIANVYRESSCLFIDGECILSEEGTTQGDPLAMVMYALSTEVPLINTLEGLATQVWFTDDTAAAGSLVGLLDRWKQLSTLGPEYGYYVNAAYISSGWLLRRIVLMRLLLCLQVLPFVSLQRVVLI